MVRVRQIIDSTSTGIVDALRLNGEQVARKGWLLLSDSEKQQSRSAVHYDIGAPLTPGSSESLTELRKRIVDCGKSQISVAEQWTSLTALRNALLSKALSRIQADCPKSSMLKSTGASGTFRQTRKTHQGLKGNRVLNGNVLCRDWEQGVLTQRVPDSVDAVNFLLDSEKLLDASALVSALCTISNCFEVHTEEVASAVHALLRAATHASISEVRAAISAASLFTPRASDCGKMFDGIKAVAEALPVEHTRRTTPLKVVEEWSLDRDPDEVPDDRWRVAFAAAYASAVNLQVRELHGTVEATFVDCRGTVSQHVLTAGEPVSTEGGTFVFKGDAGATASIHITVEVTVDADTNPAAEVRESVGLLLKRLASRLVQTPRPSVSSIQKGIALFSGGLRSKSFPGEESACVSAVMKNVRCRSSSVKAARAFVNACLHASGSDAALSEIATRATLHAEVLAQWKEAEIEVVNYFVRCVHPPQPPLATSAACDAVLHSLSKQKPSAIESALKERGSATSRIALAADVLSTACCMLPPERMPVICGPLLHLLGEDTVWDLLIGAGHDAQANAVSRVSQLVAQLMQHVADADEESAPQRPHHMLSRRTPALGFALSVMAVAASPASNALDGLHFLPSQLLRFFAVPEDMSRSESYRFDSDEISQTRISAKSLQHHLERLVEGSTLVDDSPNSFSKSGTVSFKTEAVASASHKWTFDYGRAATKSFKVECARSDSEPLCIGVVPASRVREIKGATNTAVPGSAFVRNDGAVCYFSSDGEAKQSVLPHEVGPVVHVVARSVRDAEVCVAFFSQGRLLCRVTAHTAEPLVPIVMSSRASAWELRTSFGDATGVSLESLADVVAPFPSRRTVTLAASKALYVLCSSRHEELRIASCDAIVSHCRMLLSMPMRDCAANDTQGAASSAELERASKHRLIAWAVHTALLGHITSLRWCLREMSRDLTVDVFRLLQELAMVEYDSPCASELRCNALLMLRELANETSLPPAMNVDSEFVATLFANASVLTSSREGEPEYSPQWMPELSAAKFACEGSSLSFADPTAEHIAAYAAPALPRGSLTQAAVALSVSRTSTTSMPYTFIGLGDTRTITPKLLVDYAPFLKESKRHLYVIPSRPEDIRMIASINADELKRHRDNWYSQNAVFGGGDTITVSFHWSKRTVSFMRNGRALGTLFSNVPNEIELCPFAAVFKSDTAVTVGSVATAAMPPPTTVLSLGLLQGMCENPSFSAEIMSHVLEKAQSADVAAMRVLGCDGDALGAKLVPSGRPVRLVGLRISAAGGAEAGCRTEESQQLMWVPWTSCAPQYAGASVRPLSGAVVSALVSTVTRLISIDGDDVTVGRPGQLARCLRLLADADMSRLPAETTAALVKAIGGLAALRMPSLTEEDLIDRAWGDSATAGRDAVKLQIRRPSSDVSGEAERWWNCRFCSREWCHGQCTEEFPHFIPLTTKQRRGGSPVECGVWCAGDVPGLSLTITEATTTKVVGQGSSHFGNFTCSGNIVGGTRVALRFSFHHIEPPSTSSPVSDPAAEWPCEVCTFLNPAAASRCGMCGSAKSGANWTCAACTYAFNATETTSCSMCGSRRQGGDAPAQRAAAAGVMAVCDQCNSDRDVHDLISLANEKCSTCSGQRWTLSTPVVATYSGEVSTTGEKIQGSLTIRGQRHACSWVQEPARNTVASPMTHAGFQPIDQPVALDNGSRSRTQTPKTAPLIVGISFLAKRILFRLSEAQFESADLRCDALSSVLRPDVQARFLTHLPLVAFRPIVSVAIERLLTNPRDPSASGLMALLAAVCTVRTDALDQRTANQALYACVYATSLANQEETRRTGVNTVSRLLETFTVARGEIAVRLANHPSVVASNPTLCVLQSVRGNVLPSFDPVLTAAALVMNVVDRMTRCVPLPTVVGLDLSEQLCHWVNLPQTTTTSEGHLIAGQIHGSVPARRSRKDRVYYEVEAPRNLRAVEVRMGWGTSTHGRNGATYHVGSDSHSWAYNLKNLVVCFGGENEYSPPYFVKEGDIIGSALDLESGKCWWSINGFEMPAIQVDGLLEDDEVFPYVSAALRPDNALHVTLTDTKFMPSGFREFTNFLSQATLETSTTPSTVPRDVSFYRSLNGLLDEICASGTSISRLRKFSLREDLGLQNDIEAVLPAHQLLVESVTSAVELAPYIAHLLTLSDLTHLAGKVAHSVRDSPLLTSLLQHVRYLTVLPSRWAMIERVLEGRVSRSLANTHKVSVDRKAAENAYAKHTNDASRKHTVIGQLYSQTSTKDLFGNLRMFSVSFTGEIAEDGGGLFRTVMSMIADEVMGRDIEGSSGPDAAVNSGPSVQRWSHLFAKNDHSTFFNAIPNTSATSDEDLALYQWFGKLIGNVVCTGCAVLAINFPRLVWKTLVGEDVSIEHYFHDCSDSARGALASEDFLLDDEILFETIPGARKFLPPSESRDLPVRVAARREAAEQALLHEFDIQLLAIRDGFSSVVPKEALAEMTWADLQRRVCGTSSFSAEELMQWFDTSLLDDAMSEMLTSVVESMSSEQRSKLLLFCSGQTRLPLPEKIKVACGDEPDKYPSAHTCSPITLAIQPYPDVATAKRKLLVSMAHAYEYAFV